MPTTLAGVFCLRTTHVLVGEVLRVLIHSVSMNLVWFFTGTKICHGKKLQVGGGGFVVLRIIKQRCDQLRVLVYSPDVGPIVGPKVWSLSYIFLIVQSPGVES